MSQSTTRFWLGGTLAAGALLAGCGIDQGGVQISGDPAAAGVDRTVLVTGPITGFGSVIVNDLRLDTSTAQILIDGQFATESDLQIGQVIRAVAAEEGGLFRALSIEHEENLAGPIEAIDGSGGLTVLGQTVVTDGTTRFDASLADAAGLQLGVPISVSGLPLPSGEILATYLRRAGPAEGLQVTGSITSLDVPSLSFEIGALSVDYSQAVLLQLQAGMPTLGAVVEVRGTAAAGGILIAAEVRERPFLPGLFTAAATSLTDFETPLANTATSSSSLDANFIGYLTASNLPGAISVADIAVLVDGGTLIINGTFNDLSTGTKVQVEGNVLGFGEIRADRIKIF